MSGRTQDAVAALGQDREGAEAGHHSDSSRGRFSLRPWCPGFKDTSTTPALGRTAPPITVAGRGPAPKAFLEGAGLVQGLGHTECGLNL